LIAHETIVRHISNKLKQKQACLARPFVVLKRYF